MNIFIFLLIFQMDAANPSLDFADIDPVAKAAASISEEKERRSKVLSLLPQFIDKTPELHYLLNTLQLHVLDASYCDDLTKIALQIEKFDEFHPRAEGPPAIGRYMPPDDRIKQRIAELVLPDTQAFYLDVSGKSPLGGPSDFWPDLFKWAAKNQISSPALNDVKRVFDDSKNKQLVDNTIIEKSESTAMVPAALPDITPVNSKHAAKETPASNYWLLWTVLVGLGLVGSFVFWLISRRKAYRNHEI